MSDPVMDSILAQAGDLFSDNAPEYDEAYGIGVWPSAVLLEVTEQDVTEYGFRLGLIFNLKGDSMKYTGRIDLPFTGNANGETPDWMVKRTKTKLEVLNRLLAAAGAKTVTRNIDTQADYDAISSIFRAAIGRTVPVKVSADGKNVKLDEVDEKGKDKWEFRPNGFSKLDGLRPNKKK
jgi:hypothetical protein